MALDARDLPTAVTPVPRAAAPVLVGRDGHLRALLAAVRTPPAVVYVEGEAGAGKTRLVTELAARPELAPRWMSVGQCMPQREPFPFGAVLDCLRGCGTRLAEVGGLNPVTGALRPYLPEIADRLPAAPPSLPDPAAERHRLFRATRDLLGALGPGVVILDDLHWADEGTRTLLRFLLSEPPDGLALVLTYRPEDLTGRGPLGACRPAARATTVRVRVDPLDVPAVRHLASALLGGQPVSAEFAAALHAHTAGIPFVVEEVLRGLGPVTGAAHATHAGTRFLLDGAAVAAPLREAMAERLDALPGPAQPVVHAAAVLGEPADAALLAAVAGSGAHDARAGLTEALAGNVLVEVEDCRYGFRHAPGMRAVYESLPGPRRQDLHGRAADALRDRSPLRLLHVAEHSRKAGRFADWLSYGEAAADSAAAGGDASTASAVLRRLLTEPSLGAADVDRLAAKFGRISPTGVDQSGVTAVLERLLFDDRTSSAIRGEIRLSLGLLLVRQSNGLEASRVELERAAGELRRRPALAARCMAVLAQVDVGTTPLSEHLRWMQQVEAVIEECDDPQWRTALLANVLGSRLHIGDPVVWGQIERLPEQVSSSAEQRELARAHCNLADAATWTGHYGTARKFLHSGLQLATGTCAPYVARVGRSTELHLDWVTGNWADLPERAATLMETCHDLLPVSTEVSLVLGSLAVAKGEWEAAERHLARTGMYTPDNAFTPVAIAAHGMMIALRLGTEDVAAANTEADQGVHLLRRKGVWAWAGELAPLAVEANCRAGRLADAAALTAELEAAAPTIDAPLTGAAVHRCRATLARARCETRAAIDHLELAVDGYERLPRPYEATLLAEQLTACRLELGEPAAEHLTTLADEFDRLGATRDAARCRHLARASGAAQHPRRGRRGYGNDLSPREREVARLLTHGRTNREIAEVLYLSRRTVEQHVARVLRKLGASSRVELIDPPG